MDKLDRLGWAAGFSAVAYGVRIGVRATSAAVVDRLAACLPFGSRLVASPVVDHLYSVIVGGPGPRPNVRNFHLLYAGAVGGRAGEQPLPVGLVLATLYQCGAAWRPQHLTPGQGALALLQNAVSARLHAPTVLARLQQVVTRAPALAGARGEAEELIA